MDMNRFLSDLEFLVNIDCGSNTPTGLHKVIDFFQKKLEKDWKIRIFPQNDGKNPVLVAWNKDIDKIDILMSGHGDTVFPEGTVARWSYNSDGTIATGPGVIDMKSGLLSMIEVAGEFINEDVSIALVINTDEEISSIHSREVIEELGKKSKYAMIFEPARATGTAVIGRKGLVKYQIEFIGLPSHAGNFPDKGINAVLEASNWVVQLSKLHNWEIKNSINVGIIQGGTGVNVVADYALIKFEARSHDIGFFDQINKKIQELKENPIVEGIQVKTSEIGYRPPFVPNENSQKLREYFDESKETLGINYEWEVVGGCSDGNFLNILGVGVVDGLGPVGGEAHTFKEYLDLTSVEDRINVAKKVVEKIMKEK